MRINSFLISLFIFLTTTFSSAQSASKIADNRSSTIQKIEMNLSAFGVESDDFPSVNAKIDLVNLRSACSKSYYNPAHKNSVYQLSKSEIDQIKQILNHVNFAKIKKDYKDSRPDQPASTIKVYCTKATYRINDYGLIGEDFLQKLYKIVYKL